MRLRRPPLLFIVAGILLALLPVLGYLQYRWLGKVSEREREQMQAGLKRSMDAFRQELDGEVARIYRQFQVEARVEARNEGEDTGDTLVKALDRWKTSAPFPKLVGGLFWRRTKPFEPGSPILQHWNVGSRIWESVNSTEADGKDLADPGGTNRFFTLFSKEHKIVLANGLLSITPPTLSIPLNQTFQSDLGHPFTPLTIFKIRMPLPKLSPPVIDEAVVRLNFDYLKSDYIPALLRTHFGAGLSEYRIEIRDLQSQKIYPAGKDFPSASSDVHPDLPKAVDAEEGILGLRLRDYPGAMGYSIVTLGGLATGPYADTGPASSPLFRNYGVVGHEQPIEENVVLSPYRVDILEEFGDPAPPFTTFTYRAAAPNEPEDILLKPPATAPATGLWRISATHRAGSLDAAVEQGRRRNLAAAFGILALLGASMAIVFVSANRAQRLARQQMEFVSAVSHELRTPLAVICSAGENLADGLIRDPERLRGYGKLIRDEGRRLTETVEQALGFASLQSGLKRYAPVPADARGLVESALAALDLPIREGGFRVEVEIPEGLPAVLADAPAISRAMQNLIGNALKYGGEERWIGIGAKLELPPIRMPSPSPLPGGEGFIRIFVKDRGPGIGSADLPYIFQPFYRGRKAIAAQIQGSGLGLSLVEDIVRAHGGTVEVQSGAGGSTFSILLPIADAGSPS